MRQDAKKGTALHDGIGSSMFFFQVTAEIQKCQLTLQPASEYADGAVLRTQRCCIFVFFFCISADCPSRFFFFANFVAGLATQCPVKEKLWSRKVGFSWTKKKRWRRTSLSVVCNQESAEHDVDRSERQRKSQVWMDCLPTTTAPQLLVDFDLNVVQSGVLERWQGWRKRESRFGQQASHRGAACASKRARKSVTHPSSCVVTVTQEIGKKSARDDAA